MRIADVAGVIEFVKHFVGSSADTVVLEKVDVEKVAGVSALGDERRGPFFPVSVFMRVQDLPPPSRFMFWWTAPFLLATSVLLPIVARPPEPTGWMVLVVVEVLCLCVLLGCWNAERFWWCWRLVGAIVFGGYLAYWIAMLSIGEFFGDGRRSSATVFNALVGLIVFGYPGFMFAVFGRFTWRRQRLVEIAEDPASGLEEIDA